MSDTGLLHLLTPWPQGATIVAGLAAFPPAPTVLEQYFTDDCGEDGCTSLISAGSREQLVERIAQHRKHCHG